MLLDMVVQARWDRREGWHDGVQVAGMVMMLAMEVKWEGCRGLALMQRGAGMQRWSGLDLVH